MTTPTQTKITTNSHKADTALHLRETLQHGDLAAHLVASHGLDAVTLPTSKPALARLHAGQPEPHAHTGSNGHSAEPTTQVTKTEPTEPAKPARQARTTQRAPKPGVTTTVPAAKPNAKPNAKQPAPATPEPTPAAEIARLQAQLAELTGKPAKPTKTQPAPAKPAKMQASEAKQILTVTSMLAISAYFEQLHEDAAWLEGMSKAEGMRAIAQMIHHLPTGRDAQGKRIWPGTMPRPQRSDWR